MKGENTNKNSSSGLPKNSITKQYLKKELKLVETKLRSDLASKQDLKNLETNLRSEMQDMKTGLRSEMRGMQTGLRSEMQEMQTGLRSEMQDMKTELRSEMRGMQTGLRSEMHNMGASLQGQITRIENKINTEMATKDDINRVITYMDKFVEIADTYKKQDLMRGEAIITHSDQLQNHENRIKLLESAKK